MELEDLAVYIILLLGLVVVMAGAGQRGARAGTSIAVTILGVLALVALLAFLAGLRR